MANKRDTAMLSDLLDVIQLTNLDKNQLQKMGLKEGNLHEKRRDLLAALRENVFDDNTPLGIIRKSLIDKDQPISNMEVWVLVNDLSKLQEQTDKTLAKAYFEFNQKFIEQVKVIVSTPDKKEEAIVSLCNDLTTLVDAFTKNEFIKLVAQAKLDKINLDVTREGIVLSKDGRVKKVPSSRLYNLDSLRDEINRMNEEQPRTVPPTARPTEI